MLTNRLDAVTKPDVEDLLVNSVQEGRNIEYKRALHGSTDAEKKEFLADVVSFANASGGDILYGVTCGTDEKGKSTGIPNAIPGLPDVNTDKETLRLENCVRDGIEPRVPGVQIRAIGGFESGPILILRIPRSWAAPHLVKYQGSCRFFSRTSAGKYQLDVHEIRAAFLLSETIHQRIRNFRLDRLAKIIADDGPVPLVAGPRLVLHIAPMASLDPTSERAVLLAAGSDPRRFWPIRARNRGVDERWNFDGFLRRGHMGQGSRTSTYVQLFRNGSVEAVDVSLRSCRGEKKAILSMSFEQYVVADVAEYVKNLREIGVVGPVFLMLSLLGVQGYCMEVSESLQHEDPGHLIDRDDLILPEVLIEEDKPQVPGLLRDTFDAVWQAAGWPGSPNYDEKGISAVR